MKTSALSAMKRSFKDPTVEATSPYNYDQQFALVIDGKEQSAPLLAMLYTVLLYLRLKRPMKIYIAQGRLVFEHDGTKLVQADPVFVAIITEFEAYLLAERRDGAEEMRLAMLKDVAEKSEVSASAQTADNSTAEPATPHQDRGDSGEPAPAPQESQGKQGEGGRRDHRRRR